MVGYDPAWCAHVVIRGSLILFRRPTDTKVGVLWPAKSAYVLGVLHDIAKLVNVSGPTVTRMVVPGISQ